MLHFLHRLTRTAPRDSQAGLAAGYAWPWLIMAFAAIAVPWALYPTAESGTLREALAPGTLWMALWPILIGGVLAVGLWRWGHRLPRIPEGDLVVVGETAVRATIHWSEAMEQADGYLRQWPVASLALLTLVIILSAAMMAWG